MISTIKITIIKVICYFVQALTGIGCPFISCVPTKVRRRDYIKIEKIEIITSLPGESEVSQAIVMKFSLIFTFIIV